MKSKKTIIIIIGILTTIILLILLHYNSKKAFDNCLKLHSKDYCKNTIKELKK